MTEPIPVLTLWQPWATLVALGVKRIETRSWSTKYRGSLAIAAAARRARDGECPGRVDRDGLGNPMFWLSEPFTEDDQIAAGLPPDGDLHGFPLPYGAIVATCNLVDVVPIVEASKDAPETGPWLHTYFSDLTGERAAWLMRSRSDGSIDTVGRRTGELPYGDFTQDRFAWLLDGIRPLDEPVPFKGGQGLTRKWVPPMV